MWSVVQSSAEKVVAAGGSSEAGVDPVLAARCGLRSLREVEAARAEVPTFSTGSDALDLQLMGGLPRGGISEFEAPVPGSGSLRVLVQLICAARAAPCYAAVIDAGMHFDPEFFGDACWLEHLLWARCADARQALQAVDVIARDDNFGLILLDLTGRSQRELRRVKSTLWYRLQRVVEHSGNVMAVFTRQHTVPSARARFRLQGSFRLDSLDEDFADTIHCLRMQSLGRGFAERSGTAVLPPEHEEAVAARAV